MYVWSSQMQYKYKSGKQNSNLFYIMWVIIGGRTWSDMHYGSCVTPTIAIPEYTHFARQTRRLLTEMRLKVKWSVLFADGSGRRGPTLLGDSPAAATSRSSIGQHAPKTCQASSSMYIHIYKADSTGPWIMKSLCYGMMSACTHQILFKYCPGLLKWPDASPYLAPWYLTVEILLAVLSLATSDCG